MDSREVENALAGALLVVGLWVAALVMVRALELLAGAALP
jgi:hypothetical protein